MSMMDQTIQFLKNLVPEKFHGRINPDDATTKSVKRPVEFAFLDPSGDTKIIWDADNKDEVELARKQFNEFRQKGFLAYRVVGEKGTKGEQMVSFDPDASRIIFAKAPVGG